MRQRYKNACYRLRNLICEIFSFYLSYFFLYSSYFSFMFRFLIADLLMSLGYLLLDLKKYLGIYGTWNNKHHKAKTLFLKVLPSDGCFCQFGAKSIHLSVVQNSSICRLDVFRLIEEISVLIQFKSFKFLLSPFQSENNRNFGKVKTRI